MQKHKPADNTAKSIPNKHNKKMLPQTTQAAAA
jgi:hypothetical protein